MEISNRLPTVAEYAKLRKMVGWWDTDPEMTETGLNHSLFCVVATEGDTVIGLGRITGDGGLYFCIQDLLVHPDHQSKGIGKALMQALMAYLQTNAKRGAYIALMASKGLEEFYRKFEFKVRDPDAPGMYQVWK